MCFVSKCLHGGLVVDRVQTKHLLPPSLLQISVGNRSDAKKAAAEINLIKHEEDKERTLTDVKKDLQQARK